MFRARCLTFLLALFASSSFAREFIVSSAAQIATAMATAQPGDTLTMTNGTWTNQAILFQGNGTSVLPIVLRGQTYGSVTLSGTSRLKIAGNYLVAENLVFLNGNSAPDPVVEFRNGSNESNHCRLTNSSISNYSPSDINTDNKWVSLYGTYNRVDHCSLIGKTNSGTTLVVWLTNHPNYHTIDRNYFGPRPALGFNGGETIRVGTSDWSLYDSFTTVEYNLFDQCNGEVEIISSKSCGNVYRYNTFKSCQGALTLRHGNRCTVEGNFFFGNGAANSGGIRIIGEDHTIVNNYITGTIGNSTKSALSFMNGVPNSPLNRYFQVKRAVVAFNTFVDNQTTVTIGAGADSELTLPPLDCTFANNIVYGTHSPFFTQVAAPINMTYQGNFYYGATLGIPSSGFQNADPLLAVAGSDGLRHINSDSPAINASIGTSPQLVTDMDGQSRDLFKDVGADEYATTPASRRPLTIADVGPGSVMNTVNVSLAAGWNLISNPMIVANDTVKALYPTSTFSFAYTFLDGYVKDTTMENSKGYWEKFPGSTVQPVSGVPRARDSINVVPGWNLIGTISGNVDTSTIVSIPAGLRVSNWFGFNGGYAAVTQLVVGRAYWVKANGAGKFVLTNPWVTRGSQQNDGSTGE